MRTCIVGKKVEAVCDDGRHGTAGRCGLAERHPEDTGLGCHEAGRVVWVPQIGRGQLAGCGLLRGNRDLKMQE